MNIIHPYKKKNVFSNIEKDFLTFKLSKYIKHEPKMY